MDQYQGESIYGQVHLQKRCKDAQIFTYAEPLLGRGKYGRVDGNSLHDLMMKFKHNSMDHIAVIVKSAFVTQVAKSLLQCVKARNKYMNSGFPICFEIPRVKDAMHTP